MIGIYVDFLQTPIEVPENIEKWIICRNFEQFSKEISELKSIPEILSLGGALDRKSLEWCLNPDNEGKRFPYEEGLETAMKCLVMTYQICHKNNLVYKDITLHGEHPQLNRDMLVFISHTCRPMGITPPVKLYQWGISSDYENEPNYQIFKEVSNEISRN